jgi:hypothetical protein
LRTGKYGTYAEEVRATMETARKKAGTREGYRPREREPTPTPISAPTSEWQTTKEGVKYRQVSGGGYEVIDPKTGLGYSTATPPSQAVSKPAEQQRISAAASMLQRRTPQEAMKGAVEAARQSRIQEIKKEIETPKTAEQMERVLEGIRTAQEYGYQKDVEKFETAKEKMQALETRGRQLEAEGRQLEGTTNQQKIKEYNKKVSEFNREAKLQEMQTNKLVESINKKVEKVEGLGGGELFREKEIAEQFVGREKEPVFVSYDIPVLGGYTEEEMAQERYPEFFAPPSSFLMQKEARGKTEFEKHFLGSLKQAQGAYTGTQEQMEKYFGYVPPILREIPARGMAGITGTMELFFLGTTGRAAGYLIEQQLRPPTWQIPLSYRGKEIAPLIGIEPWLSEFGLVTPKQIKQEGVPTYVWEIGRHEIAAAGELASYYIVPKVIGKGITKVASIAGEIKYIKVKLPGGREYAFARYGYESYVIPPESYRGTTFPISSQIKFPIGLRTIKETTITTKLEPSLTTMLRISPQAKEIAISRFPIKLVPRGIPFSAAFEGIEESRVIERLGRKLKIPKETIKTFLEEEVRFSFYKGKSRKILGRTWGQESGMPVDIMIDITKPPKKIAEVTYHELAHALQRLQGKLIPYEKLPYEKRPIEKEAFEISNKIMKEHIKEMEKTEAITEIKPELYFKKKGMKPFPFTERDLFGGMTRAEFKIETTLAKRRAAKEVIWAKQELKETKLQYKKQGLIYESWFRVEPSLVTAEIKLPELIEEEIIKGRARIRKLPVIQEAMEFERIAKKYPKAEVKFLKKEFKKPQPLTYGEIIGEPWFSVDISALKGMEIAETKGELPVKLFRERTRAIKRIRETEKVQLATLKKRYPELVGLEEPLLKEILKEPKYPEELKQKYRPMKPFKTIKFEEPRELKGGRVIRGARTITIQKEAAKTMLPTKTAKQMLATKTKTTGKLLTLTAAKVRQMQATVPIFKLPEAAATLVQAARASGAYRKLGMKLASLERQKQMQLLKELTRTTYKVRLGKAVRIAEAEMMRPAEAIRIAEAQLMKLGEAQLMRPAEAIRMAQAEMLRGRTLEKLKEIQKPKTPPPWPLMSQLVQKKLLRAKKAQAFNVFIKKKQAKLGRKKYAGRGFIKANKQPMTEEGAKGKGASEVDMYANRSFYIKAAKGEAQPTIYDILWPGLAIKFRARKGKRKDVGTFVEKSAYAIDSPEEVQEIPYEAMRQRQAGLFKLPKLKMPLGKKSVKKNKKLLKLLGWG